MSSIPGFYPFYCSFFIFIFSFDYLFNIAHIRIIAAICSLEILPPVSDEWTGFILWRSYKISCFY